MSRVNFKSVFVKTFLILVAGSLIFSVIPHAQEIDRISGIGNERNWEIDILGSSGTFTADGRTWNVEFLQETGGLNGKSRTLSYFGREEDNFIRLDLFVDSFGADFIAFLFEYKNFESPLPFDRFESDYRIGELQPNPTLIENYLPLGTVPDYEGPDFSIQTDITNLTASGGTVEFQGATIQVYPVLEVSVSPTWQEIWAVGVDPEACTAYYMQFFGSPNGWLFDLSTGEVFQVEFGGTGVTTDNEVVSVQRDFNLEDICQ